MKLILATTFTYFLFFSSGFSHKNYAYADGPVESLRLELSLLSSQIEDLRSSLLSPEVRSLSPSDAGIAILRLDALEAKLRATVGRVEAIEFHLQILSRDATNRISEFNSRLLQLESEQPRLENSDKAGGLSSVPSIKREKFSSDETLFFDKALLAFNRGDFITSVDEFEEFIELYPFSMNIAEAQYWLAQSIFKLENFKQAAKAYLESFSLAPSGNFASKSLLGLAISLGELGQVEQACLTLRELRLRYEAEMDEIRAEIFQAEEQLKCS